MKTPSLSISSKRMYGFSLIELLTVIAIISVLAVIAIPGLGSLRSSGNINSAILNISLLLEQSRTYALANNTYVWVGFLEKDEKLFVATVAGLTGSADDVSTHSLLTLNKTKSFDNITLGTVGGIPDLPPAEPLSSSQALDFTQSHGGTSQTFTQVIEFSPDGGARLKQGSIPRWIEVGLLPVNSGKNKEAAIQIAGLTGQVRVFRY